MQDQGNDQKNFILAMLLSGLVLMGLLVFLWATIRRNGERKCCFRA